MGLNESAMRQGKVLDRQEARIGMNDPRDAAGQHASRSQLRIAAGEEAQLYRVRTFDLNSILRLEVKCLEIHVSDEFGRNPSQAIDETGYPLGESSGLSWINRQLFARYNAVGKMGFELLFDLA